MLCVLLTQLVLEIWLKNGTHPFHDFYDFDQQICHFLTSSQKFEISHFLSLFPKYMSYQDLHYIILKLLTRNFAPSKYDMALWVRVLGLEDKVSVHELFTQIFCIFTVLTFRGSKKGTFYLSLLIFLQKGQKLNKTGLLNKSITGGPLFSSHPV